MKSYKYYVFQCHKADRCRLRATCKFLIEHADPIVFRRLSLHVERSSLHVTEHQIVAFATRSSKACELTRDMAISFIPNGIPASELSWPHFGHCDDLRVHLPIAISSLRNMTSFRWVIYSHDPDWLIDSLTQAVSRLPRLTEFNITITSECRTQFPLGLVANLSKLSVSCNTREDPAFLLSQMATAIANSPQIRCLEVTYWRMPSDYLSPPRLSEVFAKLSTKNPLRLEHLRTSYMDATVDQQMLPHLTQLTSFRFHGKLKDIPTTRTLWTSFWLNAIKLLDVEISGIITEEAMLYLSSFSGLKRLVVGHVNVPSDTLNENLKNTLFMEVLPKHVNSLHTLVIRGDKDNKWAFGQADSMSIKNCLKLKDLLVYIDGKENGMPVQGLLDIVAHLPELKILRFSVINTSPSLVDLGNFKPSKGLQYVEELENGWRKYLLERDGKHPVRYRIVQE